MTSRAVLLLASLVLFSVIATSTAKTTPEGSSISSNRSSCMEKLRGHQSVFDKSRAEATPPLAEYVVKRTAICQSLCCDEVPSCNIARFLTSAPDGDTNCLLFTCHPISACHFDTSADELVYFKPDDSGDDSSAAASLSEVSVSTEYDSSPNSASVVGDDFYNDSSISATSSSSFTTSNPEGSVLTADNGKASDTDGDINSDDRISTVSPPSFTSSYSEVSLSTKYNYSPDSFSLNGNDAVDDIGSSIVSQPSFTTYSPTDYSGSLESVSVNEGDLYDDSTISADSPSFMTSYSEDSVTTKYNILSNNASKIGEDISKDETNNNTGYITNNEVTAASASKNSASDSSYLENVTSEYSVLDNATSLLSSSSSSSNVSEETGNSVWEFPAVNSTEVTLATSLPTATGQLIAQTTRSSTLDTELFIPEIIMINSSNTEDTFPQTTFATSSEFYANIIPSEVPTPFITTNLSRIDLYNSVATSSSDFLTINIPQTLSIINPTEIAYKEFGNNSVSELAPIMSVEVVPTTVIILESTMQINGGQFITETSVAPGSVSDGDYNTEGDNYSSPSSSTSSSSSWAEAEIPTTTTPTTASPHHPPSTDPFFDSHNASEPEDGSSAKQGQSEAMLALLIGVVSVGCVMALAAVGVLGMKVYESYRSRHYSRLDYLVNGMYK